MSDEAAGFVRVSARDNPLLLRLRRLGHDGGAYRRVGQVWLEGDHLCAALRERRRPAACAVVSDSGWDAPELRDLAAWAPRVVCVPDALFASISTLDSPARIGFVLDLPASEPIAAGLPTLVLDRVQDPGNAGSMLRSAAAFGVQQVVALKGSVALWSPKVLRAGMGAHFALRLTEAAAPEALAELGLPLLATSSHAGAMLSSADLPWPCAWVMGHEGQGVEAALLARCAQQVRIPQPGGEESLNVAAAAAVCLYESLRRRLKGQ
jgi:TrmH family RNA methyltransferase